MLALGANAGSRYRVSCAFVLEPDPNDDAHIRLITRASGDYDGRAVGLMPTLVIRPIDLACSAGN